MVLIEAHGPPLFPQLERLRILWRYPRRSCTRSLGRCGHRVLGSYIVLRPARTMIDSTERPRDPGNSGWTPKLAAASGVCILHGRHDLISGRKQFRQRLATDLQRGGVGGKASRVKRIATWTPNRQEPGVEAVTRADVEDNVNRDRGNRGQRTIHGHDGPFAS